ncbi:S-formylglutathione hydrolase [Roseateles sp. BYS180W]|uniref:S-formylglutathione hydrolase n=1 Tax=Roseateles rivi TaxID=3299028 RepID=A0ABW7FX79_9BURK
MSTVATLSEHGCWGGVQSFHRHDSAEIGAPMQFSVFRPARADTARKRPTLIYLAGLTCTEETFPIKAGAQRMAAELGLTLVAPDTSPRQTGIEGADAAWDFGHGAGFYLDALRTPWSARFRMESYVVRELRQLLIDEFDADPTRLGLFGHSMGGHGALTLALRHPEMFRSVSAFAPICAPSQCPWGHKAFGNYLGEDPALWRAHDACELIRSGRRLPPLLVDQGLADKFLAEQLHPHLLEQACAEAGQPCQLRRHEGYDHGYYFIHSFIADHLVHHARLMTL